MEVLLEGRKTKRKKYPPYQLGNHLQAAMGGWSKFQKSLSVECGNGGKDYLEDQCAQAWLGPIGSLEKIFQRTSIQMSRKCDSNA